MHNPRIGRFLSFDPLAPEYPHNCSYAFSEEVIESVIYREIYLKNYGTADMKNGANENLHTGEPCEKYEQNLVIYA